MKATKANNETQFLLNNAYLILFGVFIGLLNINVTIEKVSIIHLLFFSMVTLILYRPINTQKYIESLFFGTKIKRLFSYIELNLTLFNLNKVFFL